MHDPSDAEIINALLRAFQMWPKDRDRLRLIYNEIKRRNPTWNITLAVSKVSLVLNRLYQIFGSMLTCRQRMASIYATFQHHVIPPDPLSEPQWSGVIIHPDTFSLSPLNSPESLIDHLDLCLVEFDEHGAVSEQSLIDLIGTKDAACFTNAYDRDCRIDDWYYAFYADTSDTTSAPNPIANIIKPSHQALIRGRVLVVLNGPEDGMWEVTQRIDEAQLGRSLWWYLKSGNEVRDVFGERELRRFIRTMID